MHVQAASQPVQVTLRPSGQSRRRAAGLANGEGGAWGHGPGPASMSGAHQDDADEDLARAIAASLADSGALQACLHRSKRQHGCRGKTVTSTCLIAVFWDYFGLELSASNKWIAPG